MNVLDFSKMKLQGEKISVVTCYDYSSAKIIDHCDVDCVLVGDSVAMVMHGHPNTTHATMDMMVMHTQAVARGIRRKFIVADLPFMSYKKSLSRSLSAVERLVQAGANAVKLEGAEGNLATIEKIVEAGVPVMGHLGLMPQHFHALGGFKAQGKDELSQASLLEQAKSLEAAGCFSLVLECIPNSIAQRISESLSIATIGIGAGFHTDGQVLVLNDLLGFQPDFKPKFLKHYHNAHETWVVALNHYCSEVKNGIFPNELDHSY